MMVNRGKGRFIEERKPAWWIVRESLASKQGELKPGRPKAPARWTGH